MYLKVDPQKPEARIIEIAASLIIRGEAVAFPTETVYGVGADAMNEDAVRKIFAAKGRSMDNPLLVHVSSWEQAAGLVQPVREEVLTLVEKFWPGPLTFVANARDEVPEIVRAGLPTVGLRMPDHQVALGIISASGRPIAATSANRSGRPSPVKAGHVKHDLDGKIAAVVDGGDTGWGIESTILDITTTPFRILRTGAVSWDALEQVLPGFVNRPAVETASPGGVSRSHYKTEARLIPFEYGSIQSRKIEEVIAAGKRVGVVLMNEHDLPAPLDFIRLIRGGVEEYARTLFEILREADQRGVEILFMELPAAEGLGAAVADRILESKRAGRE